MTVKTHITLQDFLNFNFKNSLPRMVIFSMIILVFFMLNFYNSSQESEGILQQATIWFAVVFVFMIVRSYFRLKNAFLSNKRIQEEITYTFTDEKVFAKGETFESDFLWNSVYRVKENNKWFLMYQSKTTMNMIPKKYFSESEISELRKMIKNSGVKAKLLTH
ncbi:YcxB family protein [Chryseobacterium sp.]|uniref:YcxB family protein n=1 Tax=Chryseobacterium sp. TaxID=1871047 RepID=UPI0028A1C96F|nr:YcxB family protein [Chryseobacterium sp.]